MGELVRIVDLAADMIRLSGLRLHEDIEIDYVGIRPGEKLYEELHVHNEEHARTSHEKIMIAKSGQRDFQQLVADIDLLAARLSASPAVIVAELQRIVPEFQRPDTRIHKYAA
jgi:FlaA1/EpsC-like NDP-sugar epimerase